MMKIKDRFMSFLKKAGEETNVIIGETGTLTYALIEPMRYKNKLYLEMPRDILGFTDKECYLYLGPFDVDFVGHENETVVRTHDKAFNVTRADRLMVSGEPQYIWAVLTPRVRNGAYDIGL